MPNRQNDGGRIIHVDQIMAAIEQMREQFANQLGEVVQRTGRIERQIEVLRGECASDAPDVETLGSRFWTIVETGGVRTAVPVVRVKGHADDGDGTISYNVRRTDVETSQGPPLARPISQLFPTKEAAETAPRHPSSSKTRKVSTRT